ncbi:MAG: dCTP deaminase [Thermoprotei archaeon]|jgi:dCTP deaminase
MLSSEEIKDALGKDIVIDPYSDGSLGPSGYDMSLAFDLLIPPLSWTLASTLERLELSASISASIYLRSSLAREGLIGSFALIDPGFRGNLTMSLFNASDKQIKIRAGERAIQVAFFRLGKPTLRPYSGKYQNSSGVVGSKREVTDT